jgi:nicotinamidase-related amidase
MKRIPKDDFLIKSRATLEELYDKLSNLIEISLNDLRTESTVLILMDMVNGFARSGALHSPRVEALIPGVVRLLKACNSLGVAQLAFADNHSNASPEFESYPAHCLADTDEAELVEEIKSIGGYQLIPKNSTNSFLEPAFQRWLEENRPIDTFIVVGNCTDICVGQFAITLKSWFNRKDQKVRVIVPVNLVDTYDLGLHYADFMNLVELYNMMGNGVEVVSRIAHSD